MNNPFRLPLVLMLLMVFLVASTATGRDDPARTAAEMITPAADKAIESGLEALANHQAENGSFGTDRYRGNVGVSGLVGMAFLAGGSTPGRGPYGNEINLLIDYLLASTQQSGFIQAPGTSSGGPMYGHGFATLFLAECYGMSRRPELRDKLDRAVKLIVTSQKEEGGWRYYPQCDDMADISVTVCQVMTLRAARNAGIHVPRDRIDRAIDYVKRSQNADGGFMYTLKHGGASGFPRSAAGIVALYSAGIYEGPEIKKGLEYLNRFRPSKELATQSSYFYYGHYYAIQAMWQEGGDSWEAWYPAIRDQLINRQQPGGLWKSSVSTDCDTAMACIVLQIPNNCVPIFQR